MGRTFTQLYLYSPAHLATQVDELEWIDLESHRTSLDSHPAHVSLGKSRAPG
jgi:hypothetical protein